VVRSPYPNPKPIMRSSNCHALAPTNFALRRAAGAVPRCMTSTSMPGGGKGVPACVECQAVPPADGHLRDRHAAQRGHPPRLALVAPAAGKRACSLGRFRVRSSHPPALTARHEPLPCRSHNIRCKACWAAL
jgi:hypothetical protein